MSRTANNRIYKLFYILQFARLHSLNTLSVGERIMINQEIGTLLYSLDFPQTKIRSVSSELETKIDQVQHLIAVYEWQPFNEYPYNENQQK